MTVKKATTLVSELELIRCVRAEGLDASKVCVVAPRWAETAPRKEGAKSALVTCDLIVRSDGSAVGLDGCMGEDSKCILRQHVENYDPLINTDWDVYVASLKG